MNFIEVHTESGDAVLVNINNIDYIRFSDTTYTRIYFNDGIVLDVSEKSETIATRLAYACKN